MMRIGLSRRALLLAALTVRSARAASSLRFPIGIKTAGDVFTPLVPAGRNLPVTVSETFGNQTDGQSEVLVELSQKLDTGLETVASLRIAIPPAANRTLNITVTLNITESRQMQVKTTVSETARVQQFGPYGVR